MEIKDSERSSSDSMSRMYTDDPDVNFTPLNDISSCINSDVTTTIRCISVIPERLSSTVFIVKNIKDLGDHIFVANTTYIPNDLRIKNCYIIDEYDIKHRFDIIYDAKQQTSRNYVAITMNSKPLVRGNCLITGRDLTSLTQIECITMLNSCRLSRVVFNGVDNLISAHIELNEYMKINEEGRQ